MVEIDRRSDSTSRERIAILETQLGTLGVQHKEMSADIKKILATLAEAKGGWRMLMLVGGAGGAVGGLIAKWANHITLQ